MKCRILLTGCGWRSQIYRRAISNLPEHFELCGILMHSDVRAKEIESETGIPSTADMETALSWNPDFTILCVPKPAMKDWVIRFMKRGIPVLSETPPGINIDELNELWNAKVRLSGKVQVAEQYFLQPYYSALKNIIDSGILGEISNVNISAIHGYHCISIFRHLLGIRAFRALAGHQRVFGRHHHVRRTEKRIAARRVNGNRVTRRLEIDESAG